MKRDEDFAAYVSGRWTALVRSAALLGCTQHDAEDLVQTTLARCYVNWPKVGGAISRDAYVHRVLVNCHADSRRRRWWGETPTDRPPETPVAADPVATVDAHDAIEHALAGLSPPYRAVLVLRFFAHLSEAETAEALGIPLGTVKSRSSRALAELSGNSHLADLVDGNAS
jgi:RNA polymerase sigma-70 factor (sigma-E family)